MGSITGLVVQLPLCSAVFIKHQTPVFEPFGNLQRPTISNEFDQITAHIENLCSCINQLRRKHGK